MCTQSPHRTTSLQHGDPESSAGRGWRRRLVVGLSCLMLTTAVFAAACASEDFDTHVDGQAQCLLMRRYGPSDPAVMVVWLHGDVSSGGAATYHFGPARHAAEANAQRRLLSVALLRPGYADDSGEASGVDPLQAGRNDHYTRENLSEVGAAIARLREHFRAQRVMVVGHSGGAATAAVLLGMQPGLIDAAVLVACPCDLQAWRAGRRPWTRSENPMQWADRVPTTTQVIALTGTADTNTVPALAEAYVARLRARGVEAEFEPIADATHNSALRSPLVGDALARLLAR